MRKWIGYAALTSTGIVLVVMLFTNLLTIGLIADIGEPRVAVQTDNPNVTYEITEWNKPVYSDEKELIGKKYIQPADNRTFTAIIDGTAGYGTVERGYVKYDEEHADTYESIGEINPGNTIGPISELNQSEFNKIQNQRRTVSEIDGWGSYGTLDTVSNKSDTIITYPFSEEDNWSLDFREDTVVHIDDRATEIHPYNYEYKKKLTLNSVTIHNWRPALVYTDVTGIRTSSDYDALIRPVGSDSLVLNRPKQEPDEWDSPVQTGKTVERSTGITVERSDRTPEEAFEDETRINPTEVKKIVQPSQMKHIGMQFELVNESQLRAFGNDPLNVTDVSGQEISPDRDKDEVRYQTSTKPIGAAVPTNLSPAYKRGFATIWENLDTSTILEHTNSSTSNEPPFIWLEYNSHSYFTYYDSADGNVFYASKSPFAYNTTSPEKLTVSYTQNGERKLTTQLINNFTNIVIVELPCEKNPCQYHNITIQHDGTTTPNGTVPAKKKPKMYKYSQMDVEVSASADSEPVVKQSYRAQVGDYQFSDYETVDMFDRDSHSE